MRRRRGDQPLSKEEIFRAALAIVDEHGLAALTMRRLGDALQVEAMSLYGHIRNKDELLDRLADLVMADVATPLAAEPVEAARELARGFRTALLRHPNLLPVLARRRSQPSNAGATQRDVALGLARAAGLDADLALVAYMTIVSFVAGHVITHAGLIGGRAPLEGPDADRVFEEGLEVLIAGLLSRAGSLGAAR